MHSYTPLIVVYHIIPARFEDVSLQVFPTFHSCFVDARTQLNAPVLTFFSGRRVMKVLRINWWPYFWVLVVIVTQHANPFWEGSRTTPSSSGMPNRGPTRVLRAHRGPEFRPFPCWSWAGVQFWQGCDFGRPVTFAGGLHTGTSTTWQVESIILRDVFVAIEDPEFQVLVSKHWYRYLMIFTVKECKQRKKIWPDTDVANRLFDNVPLGNSVLWELRALVCNLLHC